ncbi:hypothetical protein Tco_0820647 [Tanacetum coccineum]|uniref:Uncharacterized protein n=1 Tax=Tanacetum coccineum TaxID=301880 RepID=A0ABQ5AE71_9ASTR
MAALKFASSHNMIQALVDKKKVIITETSIRRDLQLADENGTECLPNATIFAELERMMYENLTQKLTFYKAFFSTLIGNFPLSIKCPCNALVFKTLLLGTHLVALCLCYHTGKDFSGRDTPLFPTMIVQAQEQEGEGSEMPIVRQHTPTINQPSSSQPPKKQKPRNSKKQNTEVSQPSDSTKPIADEAPNDENVTTHYNDPLLSGLKRLRKVGRTARIESSEDEGLGNQEDASKQGRKIADINADEEVTLIDETQGRNDDNLMFDTGVLDEQEVEKSRAQNPKAVTTIATTTKTSVNKDPWLKGYSFQSQVNSQQQHHLPQLPHAKDQSKAKMVEPETFDNEDQILIDEEITQRLQEELQAELEEEERLSRQKEEDANIAE